MNGDRCIRRVGVESFLSFIFCFDRNVTGPYSEPGVSLTSAFEPPHGEDFAAACHGRPRDGGRRAVWRGVVVELVVTGPLWGAGHAHGWQASKQAK